MIMDLKAKAAWSEQRQCWRLDIQYVADGKPKRTFLVVPDAAQGSAGEQAAKQAAKDFRRGLGSMFSAFMSKQGERPAPKITPPASPMRRDKGPAPTIAWLFDQCLTHPEIWGRVKHSKNYRSGVKMLNALIGDRFVSEFEPPHGRAIIVDMVTKLRAQDYAEGYVRKVTSLLRQALCCCVGEGITDPITHPITRAQLINDVPRFPSIAKSKGRTAILEQGHERTVFEIIEKRFARARDEERAYGEKHGKGHELGQGANGTVALKGDVVWLNPRRYSSTDWRVYGDFLRFLIESGMRRSEALTVGNHSVREREILDDDGEVVERYQVIHLPGTVTKNSLERFVNLTPTTLAGMKMWQAFARPHEVKIGDRTIEIAKAWFPLTGEQVTRMWVLVRRDAKAEGIDLSNVSIHNIRHTHATRMAARGLHGKALSDTLGHSDERSTRIYDHSQSVDLSRKFFARNVGAGVNPSTR